MYPLIASVVCAICQVRFEYPIAPATASKVWGFVRPEDQGCVEVTAMAGDNVRQHMAAHRLDGSMAEYLRKRGEQFAAMADQLDQS